MRGGGWERAPAPHCQGGMAILPPPAPPMQSRAKNFEK